MRGNPHVRFLGESGARKGPRLTRRRAQSPEPDVLNLASHRGHDGHASGGSYVVFRRLDLGRALPHRGRALDAGHAAPRR